MRQNIGPIERVLRVTLGAGLLLFVLLMEGKLRWIGLIGVLPLVTGILGLCPTYLALGIRMDKKT